MIHFPKSIMNENTCHVQSLVSLTGPEMVPVAHMSPGCILQPLTV